MRPDSHEVKKNANEESPKTIECIDSVVPDVPSVEDEELAHNYQRD